MDSEGSARGMASLTYSAQVLKTGTPLSAQERRQRLCSLSLQLTHPGAEGRALGLLVRWGLKPAQSPNSQTETSAVIMQTPFPTPTPSRLGEISPGSLGKKKKMQAQIIVITLII